MSVLTFNEVKKTRVPAKDINEHVQEKPEEIISIKENIEEIQNIVPEVKEPIHIPVEETQIVEEFSGYKLYRDKQENFCCEVTIEGARMDTSTVRLIIESPEWNLLFNGTIENNGKCTIPIKKIDILQEGTIGKIRVEVIADDSIFVPWEDEFKVKVSKKVSIKMNETKTNTPNPIQLKSGVSINIKK